jgi:DNA helicase II / ATP-dependent DNA helicase PcrA
VAKQKTQWSIYQQAIFDDIKNGANGTNTVVIAVAGSGKTSTLIEGFRYIPKRLTSLMLAFGKANADELRERAPSYVYCATFHSLGFTAIKNSFGSKVALDPHKTTNIITKLLEEQNINKQDRNGFDTIISLERAVSLCKNYLVDTPAKIDDLMDDFDIDTVLLEREDYIKNVCQILRRCKEEKRCIDYNDMIFFPYVFNLPVGQWDRVFIDETQDLSAAQIHMALKACKKGGRILALGDPKQAIFAFRGADNNSVDNVIKRLNAKVLPLSVSYRCAKKIVKLAQEIVPDIQAAPNAKEGKIIHLSEKGFLEQVRPGDFILSRLNAPLIYHCLALLRMKVPANIKGRDVGAQLNYMIRKSEKKTVGDFLQWLADWKTSEIARLKEKGRDPILIVDKAACLETLCEGARSLSEVSDNIKTLFNDGDDGDRVILSTSHRAKGLERDRVFMLCKTYRRDMNPEENNIIYVSWTRAKNELYLVY